MRILLLTDNYPPESNPSALRSSAHAQRWAALTADVTVVTSFPNFPEGRLHPGYRQRWRERRLIAGVDVVRIPTLIFPNAGFATRVIDFLSYMTSASIASLFVKRPDVVVATSPQFFAAVAGWFVSVARRTPFVFELRDLWPDSVVAVGALKESFVIRLFRRIEYFLYRRASLIVAVTEAFRTHLEASGIPSEKIAVVRNGVDLDAFSAGSAPAELRSRLGVNDKTVISYIGTIGMAHGLDILLDVAAQLKTRAPEVRFLIVGAGAERDRLRAEAQRRQLSNFIFIDRVPHHEIIHYWWLSDATLVLLRDDPVFRTVIPSKIFEAMATGTPIITNVQGELDNLLRPIGAAIHVSPGNPDELADAIVKIAQDPPLRKRLSEAGLGVGDRFCRRNNADEMLKLLQGVVSDRHRSEPTDSSNRGH